MKKKMEKNDIREAVGRVVNGKETVEDVVRDLKKDKEISVSKLSDWVKERTGIMTTKERTKAISCVLNNKEDVEEVAKRFNVPKETLLNWIKKNEKNREIGNLKAYHGGIRRDDYKVNIYARFKMDIGIKFSTIRFSEIMYREFCKNNSDIYDDIDKTKKIGRDYKINLNHVDRETTYNQISLNYLVIIHECFDNYLNNLLELLKEGSRKEVIVKVKDKDKEKKEPILDCILRNMDCNSIKNHYCYKICNYYRLTRNAYIHDGKVEKPPQIEVMLPNKEVVKPNEYSKICFKDADLFAFLVIEMGEELYRLLDLDIEKIIKNRNLDTKLKLEKYNKERAINKLMHYFEMILPNKSEELNKEISAYINKM